MENTSEITKSYIEGALSVFSVLNASSRKIYELYINENKDVCKDRKLRSLVSKAKKAGVTVITKGDDFFKENATGTTHGGVMALVSDRVPSELSELFKNERGFLCLLEGVEDPFNFGFSLRSLYAAGVTGLILSKRNWMSAAAVTVKSSAGTSEMLPFATYDNTKELINEAKNRGYRIVCASENGTHDLYSADLAFPLLLIVGGEKRGMTKEILDNADVTVRIPYASDFKNSLPTSSSATLLAFEAARKNNILRKG